MANFNWPPQTPGSGTGSVTNIATTGSVTGGPITTTGTLSLVNDNASPGNSFYYGTNNAGTKGFFALTTGGTVTSIAGSGSLVSSPNPITSTGTIGLVNDSATPGNNFYYGTNGSGTKGFFALATAPVYPITRIPFGDGTTAGGITSANLHYAPLSDFKVEVADGVNFTADFTSDITGFNHVWTGLSNQLASEYLGGTIGPGFALWNITLSSQNGAFARSLDLDMTDGFSYTIEGKQVIFPTTYTDPTDNNKSILLNSATGQLFFGNPTATVSLTNHEIAFGDSSNQITSNTNFTYNVDDDRFSFGSTIDTDHGIFYNGTGAPNALNNHLGVGMDFFSGAETYTFGNTNTGNACLTINNITPQVNLQNTGFTFVGDAASGNGMLVNPSGFTSYFSMSGVTENANISCNATGISLLQQDVATTYSNSINMTALSGIVSKYTDIGTTKTAVQTLDPNQVFHEFTDAGATFSANHVLDTAKARLQYQDVTNSVFNTLELQASLGILSSDDGVTNSNVRVDTVSVQLYTQDVANTYVSTMQLGSTTGILQFTDVGTGSQSRTQVDAVQNSSYITDATTYQSQSTLNATTAQLVYSNITSGVTTGITALTDVTTIGAIGSGNTSTIVVDDSSQTYTLNKLGGGGTQMVTADNAGVLGTAAIPTGEPIPTAVAYSSTFTAGVNDSNTHIFFNTGTGASGVDLNNVTLPVGFYMVISDLDGISSTSNIVVTFGAESCMTLGGATSTITMAIDGSSITVQKVATGLWMQI